MPTRMICSARWRHKAERLAASSETFAARGGSHSMIINIETRLVFRTTVPTDILLQYEAAAIPEQKILRSSSEISGASHRARVAADEDIGTRCWLNVDGEITVHYRAEAETCRMSANLAALQSLPVHLLPADTVKYLLDSRYCQGDSFQSYAAEKFGAAAGGAKIDAMRQWVADNIAYTPGSSHSETTARDTFIERKGVCRDFAHVLITMARACSIPARYVAAYGPDVAPADFHAVAEVFLADPDTPAGGAWYLVDPTGMVTADDAVKIGVGRDAADVSFLTCFGTCEMTEQSVQVVRG
jgi:transglutaminase-like putative cysteine protease